METFWFTALCFMLTFYIVLDGFDLGAGIILHIISRTDEERRTVLKSIGPVWDGNEVWLIAGGGTLFFAFPKLYASLFSGFYLPLMMVLWLLIGRALGIELRKHVDNPLWRSFWDFIFAASSLLLTLVLGAALGNIIRGVPIEQNGFFFEPLWTTFTLTAQAGILDWFTLLMALVTLFTFTVHGANYVSLKTEGDIQKRARKVAVAATFVSAFGSLTAFFIVLFLRDDLFINFSYHLWGYLILLASIAGLTGMFYFRFLDYDLLAFLSSSLFIAASTLSTAFGMYPFLLKSTIDPANSLTIHNSSSGKYAMQIGMYWWLIAIALAAAYFVYLYYIFRGKVKVNSEEGY